MMLFAITLLVLYNSFNELNNINGMGMEDKSEWYAVNETTGERVPVDMTLVNSGGSFRKVFLKELGSAIGCTGSQQMVVMAHLFSSQNSKNEIYATHKMVSSSTGVGIATVTRVIIALKKGGHIRLLRNGVYILNPDIMHYGSGGNKMAILKIWNNLEG